MMLYLDALGFNGQALQECFCTLLWPCMSFPEIVVTLYALQAALALHHSHGQVNIIDRLCSDVCTVPSRSQAVIES